MEIIYSLCVLSSISGEELSGRRSVDGQVSRRVPFIAEF